jgi:hypothetical protein
VKAFEIVKTIYTRPLEAFDSKTLEETFEESIIWYVGLWMVGLGLLTWTGRLAAPGLQGVIWAIGGALIGLIELGLACWFTRILIRKQGADLPLQPFISGVLWSFIALTPLTLLLGLLPYRWPSFIPTAIGGILIVICVQKLSGVPLKSVAKSVLIAFLSSVVIASILLVIFGFLTSQFFN